MVPVICSKVYNFRGLLHTSLKMSLREKVVRLENVSAPKDLDVDKFLPLVPLLNMNNEAIIYHETSTENSSITTGTTLPSLPEEWPSIPELATRHNWDYSTATHPSINKATAHLELLQTIIEDWTNNEAKKALHQNVMETRTLAPQTTETPTSLHTASVSPNQESDGHNTKSPPVRVHHYDPGRSSAASSLISSQELSIQGIGAQADTFEDIRQMEENTVPSPGVGSKIAPYLGAEEVLDEVTALLAHLEKDRREAKEALQHERNRRQTLASKIDNLAHQRMTELPNAVQKEHEACAMDINELNWHVSYRSRVLTRLENRVATAETLNERLQEDITFVKKHCPLVEEKLELEKDAMNRIRNAQTETNDELGITVERCAKAENKSEEAFSKAEAERTHIKNDLAAVERDLSIAREELERAKKTYDQYIVQCNNSRDKLKNNNQELAVLEVKCEKAKVSEAMHDATIKDYEGRIVEQKLEHKRLTDDNVNKEAILEVLRRNNSTNAAQMLTKIQQNELKLRTLTRFNQELDLDIEDYKIKIKQCEHQQIADKKNLARMAKEMERTKEQIRATDEQLTKIRDINSAFHQQMNKERENYTIEEERLLEAAKDLQKRVDEEKHRRTLMQARMLSRNKDLDTNKVEAKQEEDKKRNKAIEIEKQIKAIIVTVSAQRKKYAEISKIIKNMQNYLNDVMAKQKALAEQTEKTKSELLPTQDTLKEEKSKQQRELEHMQWKMENMQQNIKDMQAFQARMEKTIIKTDAHIYKLQDELDDLTVDVNTKHHIINELKSQLEQVNARYRDHERRHKTHMQDRQKCLLKTEEDFNQNIKLNGELAASYRSIQNNYITLKNKVLNSYSSCIELEHHIKDLKQVQGLQAKLHHVLLEYYKYRGLYNKSELGRMSTVTTNNAIKVGELKSSMDDALGEIKYFLSTEMSGSKAHEMAMKKVQQEQISLAKIAKSTSQTSLLVAT